MKNITGCAKDEGASVSGHEQLIRRLAHDLRQPLSSIECIGYYLDMVLGERAPELQKQCELLRRMVHQAHWLLEDVSLAVSVQGAECGPVRLAKQMARLGAEMALHEQRSLDLRLEMDVVVVAPVAAAANFCGHVLSFLRNVAECHDPILVTAAVDGDVCLEISAEVGSDPGELLALVNPAQGGGLRAFVEAAQGQMTTRVTGQRLTLLFWLPRGE